MIGDHQLPLRNFDNEEDVSESLSPSDGYFNSGSQIPQNVYVPDPSQENTMTKAQESMGHRSGSQSPEAARHVIYTPSSSQASTSPSRYAPEPYRDHSPLLSDPPPGYEAAISTPSSRNTGSTIGQATSNQVNGRSEMNVGEPNILEPNGPQSMSDPRRLYEDEEMPTSGRRRDCRGRRENRRRSGWRIMLMFILGLVLGTWLIGSLLHKARRSNQGGSPLPNPSGKNTTLDPDRHPRELRIHESSHSVSGTFPLRDLLEITTSSGSINIVIDPKDAPAHAPHTPARLVISSNSGSVRVSWPSYISTPDRIYMTSIKTSSGTISGSFVHGTTTDLVTKSGSISADIWPFFPDGEIQSQLRTQAVSGSQTIKVLSPAFNKPLRNITAEHVTTGSGSLRVTYPTSWEGKAMALSGGSGSVSMSGPGLDVEPRGARKYVGYKGEGSSDVLVECHGSGSVKFQLSPFGVGGQR